MTQPTTDSTPTSSVLKSSGRADAGVLALCASACVLAGLVLTNISQRSQANLDMARQAYAEAVNQGGQSDASLVTAEVGSGEDYLFLVDQRREEILAYRVMNQRQIEFKGRESIREIFVQARGGLKRGTPPAPAPNTFPPSSPAR